MQFLPCLLVLVLEAVDYPIAVDWELGTTNTLQSFPHSVVLTTRVSPLKEISWSTPLADRNSIVTACATEVVCGKAAQTAAVRDDDDVLSKS